MKPTDTALAKVREWRCMNWKDGDATEAIHELMTSYEELVEENKKMWEALKRIQTQDVPFEIDTTLHLECREIAAQSLFSLSTDYSNL